MPKEQSTEIAVRSSSDIAALDDFDAILRGQKDAPPAQVIDDPAEISKQIVDQILSATTEADVFSVVGNTLGWREIAGVPVELHGYRWRPSDYTEGAPVFVIVFATRLDTGEQIGLTTGALNVLAQLSALARLGKLDGTKVAIREAANPTAKGYRPLHLIRVGSSDRVLDPLPTTEQAADEAVS